MATVSGVTQDEAGQSLELRMPLGVVAVGALPAAMMWGLAIVLIPAGDAVGVAMFLAGAVGASVLLVRTRRMGATVGRDGIEVRTVGRTRRVRWRDVAGFSVLEVGRGQLVVNTAGGESFLMAGLPGRDYRRRHYRSGRLLDNVVADLRHRLEAARAAGE